MAKITGFLRKGRLNPFNRRSGNDRRKNHATTLTKPDGRRVFEKRNDIVTIELPENRSGMEKRAAAKNPRKK